MIRLFALMAWKDLTLMSRDRAGMFFILIFPILMGLFFGFIMQGSGDTENAQFDIAFCDEDETEYSAAFREAIEQRDNVTLHVVDRAEALDRVRRSGVAGAILIPPGFGETAGVLWQPAPRIEIAVDPSRPAEGGMIEGFVMQAIGELTGTRLQDPQELKGWVEQGRDALANAEDTSLAFRTTIGLVFSALDPALDEWQKEIDQAGAAEESGEADGITAGPGFSMKLAEIERIDVTRKKSGVASQVRSGWDISIPQAIVWSILGVTSGFAIGLVREKEAGTLMRLQASPLHLSQILLGKAAGCYIALCAVISLLCAIGYALGMRPNSWPMLLLAIACIGYCFVGVMMLLTVLGNTEESVSGASWGINVLMAMFGGGMIPLAFLPGLMRTLSHASPIKWAVLSMEGAIWRDFSLGEMAIPIGVLLAVGTLAGIFGTVSLTKNSTR